MKKELLLLVAVGVVSQLAFSKEERMEIGRKVGWQCQKPGCRKSFYTGWLVDIDHKIPVSKGGRDDPRQAQVLCLHDHAEKTEADGDFAGARLIRARIAATGGGRTEKWLAEHRRPLRSGRPFLSFKK